MPRWERAWKNVGMERPRHGRVYRLSAARSRPSLTSASTPARATPTRPRTGSNTATAQLTPLRQAPRRKRPPRAISRQVLGRRQRDVRRLAARPPRRRPIRSQVHRVRKCDEGGRPSIKLIAVGVPTDNWGDWNRIVARTAGSYFDYLSVHDYRGLKHLGQSRVQLPQHSRLLASGEERMLAETSRITDEAAGKRLPLAFDEWNVWFPDEKYDRARRHICRGRDTGDAAARGPSDDGEHSAARQRPRRASHKIAEVVETPVARSSSCTRTSASATAARSSAPGPSFDTPSGRQPLIDACATISADRKKLAITVINRDPLRDIPAKLSSQGLRTPPHAPKSPSSTVRRAYSFNTYTAPDTVIITRTKANLDLAQPYVFPAHSVTVITLAKGQEH